MTKNFPAYLLLAALAFWAACNKPSPFGAELLDDQIADYAFTDTLSLRCSLLQEDSALTSDRSSTAAYFLCGQLNDPTFGVSQAEIFSLLRLDELDPNFDAATDQLDSIVLFLKYDPAGFYGDSTQAVSLRVSRLTQQLRWDEDYYSNESLAVGEELGAVENFQPKHNTLLTNPFDTASAATKHAYLRVPLSQSFGQYLLGLDSALMVSDSLFWQQLLGIRIAAYSSAVPGPMLSFDLNDNVSRVRMYYTRDTSQLTFDYFFTGANKFGHYTHDYIGTPVAPLLDREAPERLYLQGMAGVRMKVEIPYADKLEDLAVNKAELVFTLADVPGDPAGLEPADQLVVTELRGDTAFVLIRDVLYSLGSTGTAGFVAFGGSPESRVVGGTTVKQYRLTITDRFQEMVDDKTGDLKNRTLYVNVYPQRLSAMRSVLYGPQSATFPAKLELKYTRIQ